MRVIVVGAGITGLCTALALQRRGHVPVVVERAPALPHDESSSGDQHRLIRYPYGSAAGYARMVGEAYAGWDRLWRELGRTLYVPTGTLALAGPGDAWVTQSLAVLEAAAHPLERLTPAALAARFPAVASDGVADAFFTPSGGVLLAGAIVAAVAERLRAGGAELLLGAPVAAVDAERTAAVLADGRRVAGEALVVATGPWISRLAPALAGRAVPSRQVVAYLALPAAQARAWADMPMLLDIGAASGFYLVPPVRLPEGGQAGLKIGDHSFTRAGDPDRPWGAEAGDPALGAELLARARMRLRGFDAAAVSRLKICYYTVTPDEGFVAAALGGRAWAVSPCSGHGFKFGPVIGDAVADLVEERVDFAAFSVRIAAAEGAQRAWGDAG